MLFGVHAVTLRRLVDEIFRCAGDERRPVSNTGKRLLLEKCVQERYRDGKGLFAPLAGFPGFIGAVEGLVAEMKQSLVTPEELAETAGRMGNGARLTELARLYGRYDQLLYERGLLDRNDAELAALARLRSGAPLPPLLEGVAELHCRHIYDFTPLQSALLQELSRRISLHISFPYDFERPALFSYVSRTLDALESLDNSDLQMELRFEEFGAPFTAPLISQLFREEAPSGHPLPPDSMALMAAPGPYAECERIGRGIRRLMEDGVDPASIGVLFRDSSAYGPMQEDVCRRFRIPVSYRRGAPLTLSPLVRTILAPFRVVSARYGREELLGLLKSSYFTPLKDDRGRPIRPDLFEEVLNSAKYLDDAMGSPEKLIQRRIDALKKNERPCERESQVFAAIKPLMEELRAFDGRKSLGEFAALMERFIARHAIYRRGIEAADPRALKRDASAITLFQKVLAGLEADIGSLGMESERFTPADFASLLRQGMEGEFLAGERQAGVSIMNFHDCRGLEFDHIFAGGLNEGLCPQRQDPHPLFKDNEKLLFNKIQGKKLFRTASEKAEEEPLLFCMALSCAAKSLTLSYSHTDSRGNEMLPSPFLEELLAVLPLKEERSQAGEATPPVAECMEREELLNAIAMQGEYAALEPLISEWVELSGSLSRIRANGEIEAKREIFFNEEELSRRARLSTPYTGTLLRPDILAELKERFETEPGDAFAPTTLEEYGCCPFKLFLRRILRLSPLEEPELQMEAREEGSLVHEILRSFFDRMAGEGRLPLKGAREETAAMQEAAEEIFTIWEEERYTGEPLLWEIGKGKILSILEGVVAAEGAEGSTLVPQLFEKEFAPFPVENMDGARFFLTGKADRVDTDPASGALRVVDYKMAGNSARYAGLLKKENLGETSFQMPVYLLAAARELGESGGATFTRLIGRYWLMRKLNPLEKEFGGGKEDFTGFLATDPAERQTLGNDNFLNRVCTKVNAIKGGDFQITPRECDFCDFAPVCRYLPVELKAEEE